MSNLNKVMNGLIKENFDELSNANILIRYLKMRDGYFEFERLSRFNYLINADKSLKKAPLNVIKGGLAHELAHISKEIKMPFLLSFLEEILYDFSSKYESYDERKTDLDIRNRGLGEELLAFVKYTDNRRKKYISSDGLTKKEINPY